MNFYISAVTKSGKCFVDIERYDTLTKAKNRIKKMEAEEKWFFYQDEYYQNKAIEYFFIKQK